jgi:ribosomal protein S18 acetylase RimI-like enzyme
LTARSRDIRDELAAFITAQQSDPTTHMSDVSYGAPEIAATLHEYGRTFALHRSTRGVIDGALGIEADALQRRAAVYGPWAATENWNSIADSLWQWSRHKLDACDVVTMGHNLFNVRAEGFARRHNFMQVSDSYVMVADRSDLSIRPGAHTVLEIQSEHHDGFIGLHSSLFPKAVSFGSQISQRVDDKYKVLVALEGGEVVGFIIVEVRPAFFEGSILFVGVTQGCRGRGLGASLIAKAVEWIIGHAGIDKIGLYVGKDNPALGLYEHLGWRRIEQVRSYEKKLSTNSEGEPVPLDRTS